MQPQSRSPLDSVQPKQEPKSSYLIVISDINLELLLAQDIFSTFMCAAAHRTDVVGSKTTIQLDGLQAMSIATNWQDFMLENSQLLRMAQGYERAGLGSLH